MATTHTEEIHISTSTHRINTISNGDRDDADALESGEIHLQNSEVTQQNSEEIFKLFSNGYLPKSGFRINAFAFLLITFGWLTSRLSSLKFTKQENPHAEDYAEGYRKFKYENREKILTVPPVSLVTNQT